MGTRSGHKGMGMVVDAEALRAILGEGASREEREPTPEERAAQRAAREREGREAYDAAVASATEASPEGTMRHEAVRLMHAVYNLTVLPRRIVEPLVTAYVNVSLAADGAGGIPTLFADGGKPMANLLLLAGVVAQACGVDVAAERERETRGEAAAEAPRTYPGYL